MPKSEKFLSLEEWQECIRAAGQYLVDNADKILTEGERVYSLNIAIKDIEQFCIPRLEITKNYNMLEMVGKVNPKVERNEG